MKVAAIPLSQPAAADHATAMADALAAIAPSLTAGDGAGLALFPAGTGTNTDAATFKAAAAELARAHGVWLCPGTWLDDDGHHVSGIFRPDGTVAAVQPQTHLAPGERYVPGAQLELAETPWGSIGMLVGRDAWVPEVARILTRLGARLLLAPVAGRDPYSEWDQIAGTWAQVQQNQVFAAEAGWVGDGHSGRAAVMAPCEMTDGLTGYLARPDDGPAVAALDETGRQAVLQSYDILGLQNPELYRRYLPALYRKPAAGSGYPAGGGSA